LEAEIAAMPEGPEKRLLVAQLEEKKAEVEVAKAKAEIAHMEAELEAMPEGPEKEALKAVIEEKIEEEHTLEIEMEALQHHVEEVAPRKITFEASKVVVEKHKIEVHHFEAKKEFVGKLRGVNRKGHDFQTCSTLNCAECMEDKQHSNPIGKMYGLHHKPFQPSKQKKSRTTNPRL